MRQTMNALHCFLPLSLSLLLVLIFAFFSGTVDAQVNKIFYANLSD